MIAPCLIALPEIQCNLSEDLVRLVMTIIHSSAVVQLGHSLSSLSFQHYSALTWQGLLVVSLAMWLKVSQAPLSVLGRLKVLAMIAYHSILVRCISFLLVSLGLATTSCIVVASVVAYRMYNLPLP